MSIRVVGTYITWFFFSFTLSLSLLLLLMLMLLSQSIHCSSVRWFTFCWRSKLQKNGSRVTVFDFAADKIIIIYYIYIQVVSCVRINRARVSLTYPVPRPLPINPTLHYQPSPPFIKYSSDHQPSAWVIYERTSKQARLLLLSTTYYNCNRYYCFHSTTTLFPSVFTTA